MQDDLNNLLVVRATGSEIWVAFGGGTLPCVLRGRFRRQRRGFQVVAGDRVRVRLGGGADAPGVVEGVEERVSWLSRYNERDAGERLIVANVDRLFVVAAVKSPPLHLEFIDRVLVSAERGRVRATVVANKVDLADEDGSSQVSALESTYGACGYRVLSTSAATGEGVDELVASIGRGVYAFVGESGVGKTSLLMRIDPDLELAVREVGNRTGRGRHTTTYSQLYPFRRGYVADTPGVQTFSFPGTDKLELPACFPEFAGRGDCRYRPCTHSHEPECVVKSAVEEGLIARSRHESYLHLLEEVEERERRRPRN